MTLPSEVQTFIDTLSKQYANVEIKPKSSSKLMKAIGWLFGVTKISPEFMTRYITIIGSTIYFPDNMLANPDGESMLRTVAHETVHANDAKRFSAPLFSFLYLFPQSLGLLALLSLLAFWKAGFIWCLLFLLCLAPLPAPFRYWFELRAYRMNILFCRKEDKLTDEQMIPIYEWIEKQMTTSLYYWTWPFPNTIRKHLKDESWMETGIYKNVNKWLITRRVANKIASTKLACGTQPREGGDK